MHMHIKNKRGQSTVEYILLVTAVLAVIIAFVAGNGSVFKNNLNSTYTTATNDINSLAQTLMLSHASVNASTASTQPPFNLDVGKGEGF